MNERYATKTLTMLTVTLSLYLILWQVLAAFMELPVYYYGRLIELLGLGLFAALSVTTPMKFEDMGIVVKAKTLFRSLAEGLFVGSVFLLILLVMRPVLGVNAPFSWHVPGDVSRATYFVVAPLQEILAKSAMLYSFELVFEKRHPRLAVCMSALVFGAFHVVYGIKMMLLAAALSIVTGVMFCRNRCVWGCAVAHFACGFFPACFGF